MKRVLLILCLLLLPFNAFATTYYVDNTNGSASDSNAGTNPAAPWLTIGKCGTTLVAGDTCTVQPGGTYNARISPTNSGTAGNVITYIAGAGTRPKVRGFTVSSKLYITINGFEITNTGMSADSNPSVLLNASQHVTVINNYIHDTTAEAVRSDPNSVANRSSFVRVASNTMANIGPSNDRANDVEIYGDDTLVESNDAQHGSDFFRGYGLRLVSRNNTTHDTNESEDPTQHLDHFQTFALTYSPVVPTSYVLVENNVHKNNVGPNAHFATINGPDGVQSSTFIFRYNLDYATDSYFVIANEGPQDHVEQYSNTVVNASGSGPLDYTAGCGTVSGTVTCAVINNIFYNALSLSSSVFGVISWDASNGSDDYNLGYFSSGSKTFAAKINNETHKILNQNPTFVNAASDWNLQAGSPAIATGGPLTTVAVADTSSGTSLVLTDAHFFQDGWAGVSKDYIAVGTVGNTVQVSSINYSTNTITLANAITRSDNDPVWLYKDSDGTIVLTGAAPDIGAFPYSGADTTPPVPGSSGTITAASIATTTLTLNWTKATDAVSAQNTLQYEVRRSTSNNINSVANAEANGTIVNAYATDIATAAETGLSAATSYYFNVIVKDEAGNKAVYTAVNVTTSSGGGGGGSAGSGLIRVR